MDPQLTSFFIVLAMIWFLLYWILGGVFFAFIAILRLGRVRTMRFSCLFTLWALASGVGASYFGLSRSQEVVGECLAQATTKAQTVTAIFGCGFANILFAFLAGAAAVTLGGFVAMELSKSKSKPWIVLPSSEGEESDEPPPTHDGKFF